MVEPVSTRRAGNLEEMFQLVGRLFGHLLERAQPFTPRPDDIVISPYGKCGTTWLQQTVHTLRTRGDTDFDDISRVVPWIETSPGLGLDLDAEQKARPRAFKSHLSWDEIPKGGRYIVSFRDSRDAAVSFYKFFEGWFFEPGKVELDDFVLYFYLQRPPGATYWQHLISWWEQRDNENVLLLTYEQMRKDPTQAIRRVAAFCGIQLDEELLQLTLNNTSLDYMKKHQQQFDDLLMREASESVCGLPAGSDSSKVRDGQVGSHRAMLSESAREALTEKWQQEITSRYGFADYAEFQEAVEQLNGRRFPGF